MSATTISATVPYRVRFDECGPDGLLRTSTVLRYAQDAAWIHAEELGVDREWSRERGLTWVVRAAEVVVLRPIETGATLRVTTRLGGARKVLARRRTELRLDDGTLAGSGLTDWVVIDERGRPGRLPPDFLERFGPLAGPFEPCRVPLPSTPTEAAVMSSVARPQDLDPMAHVNNAAYLDYLEEAVRAAGPDGTAAVERLPRAVRLEYLVPASPGMRLDGAAWPEAGVDGGTWAWRLTGRDDGTELARGRLGRPAEETG